MSTSFTGVTRSRRAALRARQTKLRSRVMNRGNKRGSSGTGSRQLVVDGVPIPPSVVASGHCAAYACRRLGERDPDRPICGSCGTIRQFYDERCRCGAVKPWLFTREIADDGFDDLS